MLADHRHVLVVVLVVVAVQQFGADEALAAVFERRENAERLHAGDLGVELLADELLHVCRNEQLVDVAFAVVRRLFAVGGLVRGFLAHRLVRGGEFLAGERLLQHPVRDQVGIAADGRGEVQVELGLQAVVADALVRVAGARQRAQQQHRQHALLGVVLRAAQHDLELRGVLGLGGVDAVAERTRERREHAQLVRVGVLVDAVDRRVLVLAHILRDRFVRL